MDGQLQKMVLWYLVVGKAELERRMSCTTDDGQLLIEWPASQLGLTEKMLLACVQLKRRYPDNH